MSPAAFPAFPDRVQRRPAGPVPVGVIMEFRFHDFLQPGRGHGLRDSVRDGRHAENPGPCAMRFRYFHRFHRRREVAARGHPVPDLIEITLQIGLEVLDRAARPPPARPCWLSLSARRPAPPASKSQTACLPVSARPRDSSRACLVDRMQRTTDEPAPSLRSHRIKQELHRYYGPVRLRAPRRYSAPCASDAWGTPCCPALRPGGIGTRFPTFRTRAADQAHAASTPGTTWPVNGHPPGSSRAKK